MVLRRAALLAATLVWVVCTPARAQHPDASHSRFTGFLFGDVTFAAAEGDAAEGFLMGQLVGHGNALLTERLSFFGELSATARQDGYAFEVERAIIRYDFADALKLSVGRYHTPISYWNTAYHHGLWLQTSVARPELIRIGGTYLPVHFVGALAEGSLAAPGIAISYEAGAGNGRGALIGRAGDAGDVNDEIALVGGVRIRPDFARGLQVGGSLYTDRITTEVASADERIGSVHAVWDAGAPELIAEYAHVRHEDDASVVSTSEGFYVQGGYRLPGVLSGFKPYARLERLFVDDADPVFESLTDYDATIAGVRWDFETVAALKAEFRRDRRSGGEWLNSFFVQAAIVVPSFEAAAF
ncbi:MAG TPA: hypothetical protein VHG09_13805 [Longimicrobiales bacterium]|nr:hypothetical protein [Longimicrobiales bacterium]